MALATEWKWVEGEELDKLGKGAITRFDGDNAFLSNFYPAIVLFEGDMFPTVEHAFQAAKTVVKSQRTIVARAATPGKAKRMGKKVLLRADWDIVRVPVMKQLLHEKFKWPVLYRKLLGTGGGELVEGNGWGDSYWGVDFATGGLNVLGNLLMTERNSIRLAQMKHK